MYYSFPSQADVFFRYIKSDHLFPTCFKTTNYYIYSVICFSMIRSKVHARIQKKFPGGWGGPRKNWDSGEKRSWARHIFQNFIV